MRRFAFAGLLVTALLAFGALGSTAAFAAHVLPELTVESNATGTSGSGELGLTGANVKCKKGSLSLTATSKKAGSGSITFSECSLGGKECKSLGGTPGTIVITGTVDLVLFIYNGEHYWFAKINIVSVHIECAFLSQLILVEGAVLGNLTPHGTKTKNYELSVLAKEGKQEWTEYENDAGELVKAGLEGSINGGTKKAATETSTENKITFEKETELVD